MKLNEISMRKAVLSALAGSAALATLGFSAGVWPPKVGVPPAPIPELAGAGPGPRAVPAEEDGRGVVWATGKVEALRQAVVGSKVPGRIEAYLRQEGESVRKGEPLVLLERGRSKAEAARAGARRDQARRELGRARKLRRSRVIPASELESAETALLLAQAELEAGREAVEEAVVRAPFDGRVLKTFRESGESVTPGAPLLAIGDLSAFKVRSEVDELDVSRVRTGARAWIRPDSLPGRVLEGTVARLGGMLGKKAQFSEDPRERVDAKVLEVEVRVEGSQTGTLVPGMSARVSIQALSP